MNTILQTQFQEFHSTIKLDMDDLSKVIQKRDMLIAEIRAYLKKKSEDEGEPTITFSEFNQGSYPMGTGNEPAFDKHDYDIDSGLLFHISKNNYTPIQVKRWVFDALNIQFRTVEWKKPCIRVQYVETGLPKFHVDFAIYSDCNDDEKIYIAKGKPTLASDQNKWEVSQPKKLMELLNNKFSDIQEKRQFKRVIRYFKRWKDEKFSTVYGKPTGISLTALAYGGFKPYTKNGFSGQEEVDDHKACWELAKYMIDQFSWFTDRIEVELHVPPSNDLFAKMTTDQCKNFKVHLEKLRDALKEAYDELDPHEACKILKKQFGEDFPVPSKEETAQSRSKAVVGTNESA